MKKIKLFEEFVVEATNIKDTAKRILSALDDSAQLHHGYIPKEALKAIEGVLSKNKSLKGKDAEKAAKAIRLELEEIGILANTFSPLDVEIMIMNSLNESLDESISKSDFDKLVKDLAYSMPNHTKYDTDGAPSEEQIMAAMKKYQKGLYKYTTDAQKKEAVEMVIKILSESVINEAKELSRDEMMDILKNKYKFTFVKTTEEFNGSKGGIWTSGESSPILGGKKVYNYYGEGAAYELGVLKKFEQAIDKLGWYSEWYDAGTVMIWPV